MIVIDSSMLDELSEAARQSRRRRMNRNLHVSSEEPCQRLLNAVEPDSYVRPHRHLQPARAETFVALRGRMVAVIFTAAGAVSRIIPFSASGTEPFGLEIEAGQWHAIVSLEAGSVFFETKPGPYLPLSDKDFASWAPAEGTAEAAEFLRQLARTVRQHLDSSRR